MMLSTFEIALDQLKNGKVDIKRRSKVCRWVLAIIKFGMMIALRLFVIVIAIAMIYYVNAGQFGFVLGLTFIFLIAATIMNRVIDRYGN